MWWRLPLGISGVLLWCAAACGVDPVPARADGASATSGDAAVVPMDASSGPDASVDPCAQRECGASGGSFCGLCAAGMGCSAEGSCQEFLCDIGYGCFPVSPTGISFCRSDASSYKLLCPLPGDAFYGQDGTYQDRDWELGLFDDVVSDGRTGLQWQRYAYTTELGLDQSGAAAYCDGLVLHEQDDWRLPTVWEQFTVADFAQQPAIRFPLENTGGFYWSASTSVLPGHMLGVQRHTGVVQAASAADPTEEGAEPRYARCVRGPTITDPPGRYALGGQTNTFYDNVTEQTWGGATASNELLSWGEALSYCEQLTFAGRSDWRLPDLQELLRLEHNEQLSWALGYAMEISSDPASARIWTSSPAYADVVDGADAWTLRLPAKGGGAGDITFAYGSLTGTHRVLCTRGGFATPI